MGGHGGLNILPQKRWNVYNFDNREKVRQDEEAAARDYQLKRDQSRKHDSHLRLQQIRQAKGLSSPVEEQESKPSKHINLFEGIKILDPSSVKNDVVNKSELVLGNELRRGFKKMKKEALEPPKPVLPEDEKYRLGYGVAGKGVKLPWYMDTKKKDNHDDDNEEDDSEMVSRKRRKKSVEELREERLKREAREKERERALLRPKGSSARNDGGYSTKYSR